MNVCPSAADLERFFAKVPEKLGKPQEPVGRNYIKQGQKIIQNHLVFTHGYAVTAQTNARIHTILLDHEAKGVNTRNRAQERQWIGSEVVRQLATTVLQEAHLNGKRNLEQESAHLLDFKLCPEQAQRLGNKDDEYSCNCSPRPKTALVSKRQLQEAETPLFNTPFGMILSNCRTLDIPRLNPRRTFCGAVSRKDGYTEIQSRPHTFSHITMHKT